MELTGTEKTVIIILSILLLAGAVTLHVQRSGPHARIEIVENGITEQLTLEEVEDLLAEKRKVNINTADISKITGIPGIGNVLAERIVEYRTSRGRFYSETDLLQVEGIGEKKIEKIREYIKFE